MRNHEDEDDLEERRGFHDDPEAEDLWTIATVAKALVKALRAAVPMAGAVGPGFVSATDVFPFETSPDDEPRPKLNLTPRQVAQIEDAWEWQGRYLADLPGPAGVLKIWLRCRAYRRPFGEECKRRGWARRTAYNARDRALGTIAEGLIRDNINVWR